jgi:hypothetical protein
MDIHACLAAVNEKEKAREAAQEARRRAEQDENNADLAYRNAVRTYHARLAIWFKIVDPIIKCMDDIKKVSPDAQEILKRGITNMIENIPPEFAHWAPLVKKYVENGGTPEFPCIDGRYMRNVGVPVL